MPQHVSKECHLSCSKFYFGEDSLKVRCTSYHSYYSSYGIVVAIMPLTTQLLLFLPVLAFFDTWPHVRRIQKPYLKTKEDEIAANVASSTCVPSFFVPGVMKTGSTSLFSAIATHPQVQFQFNVSCI